MPDRRQAPEGIFVQAQRIATERSSETQAAPRFVGAAILSPNMLGLNALSSILAITT
jgi:hypothetical protein